MTRHLLGYSAVAVLSVAALACGGATGDDSEMPRTAQGTPDLTGFWAPSVDYDGAAELNAAAVEEGGAGADDFIYISTGRPCHPGQECGPAVNAERDPGILNGMNPNKPFYRPEYWERVQYLDLNGNAEDPSGFCFPRGVPRMGPPSKIVQTETEVIFLYARGNFFRVIPIDGRPHHPIMSLDLGWFGDAVGTWEGDTLVIDVVGFTDETWLGDPGYFHSNNMRVVERITRVGDTFTWQATVHDPEVFEEPFTMDPVVRTLNPDPMAQLQEYLPCQERDWQHMVSRERS